MTWSRITISARAAMPFSRPTSFERLARNFESFRKPRTGFPILFHYASLNRNEGRHELGGPLCLKVERAESPVPLALSLWLDSSLVGGIEQGGNQNAANRLSHSLRCLLPHLIRFFGSEEGLTEELHFNLRDEPENAEALVFDRERGGMSSLLPDLYMLDYSMTHRSSAELSPQSFATRFLGRRPQIFWRGSTTGGNGLGSSQLTSLSDLARNPRVLACLRLRDIAGSAADCKITRLVQCADGDRSAFVQWLTEHSIFDLEVEEQQFALYQMYLDLPGNGSAWGTFKKYLYGCLVIVPESSRELAYHRHLSPWHHFIPVKADLSDIAGIVSWVYDNQAQAASIQGNRISNLSQHTGEEAVAPGGPPELFWQRALGAFATHQVECHVAQDGEVLRAVVQAVSRPVFVHGDVQAPV